MNKVNLFYFTGTQQNGILVVPRDNEAVFFLSEEVLAGQSLNPILII